MELIRILLQPLESLRPFKKWIVIRLWIIPIPNIQNPTRLMLGESRGRQPFNAVSWPVFLFGFLKLLPLKLWIPERPDDVQPDTL